MQYALFLSFALFGSVSSSVSSVYTSYILVSISLSLSPPLGMGLITSALKPSQGCCGDQMG